MWSGTPYSDFKHLSWFWTPFSVSRLPCYSDLFFNILFLFPNIIVLFPNSLSCFRMPNTDLEHTISIFQLFLVFGSVYRIVASRSTSQLVTCLGLFRLLMKGIFGPYVLWPLDKKLIFWIVTRVSARDYTVAIMGNSEKNHVISV